MRTSANLTVTLFLGILRATQGLMNAKSWTRQLVRRPDGARRTSRTGGLSSIYRALVDVFKVNGLSGGEGVLWVLRLPDLSLGSLGSANLLTGHTFKSSRSKRSVIFWPAEAVGLKKPEG